MCIHINTNMHTYQLSGMAWGPGSPGSGELARVLLLQGEPLV